MPLDHTDAWHPTVNPSARMPIHHHRHHAVLGHGHGILNETPRRRGGTTLRLPRIHNGRLHVLQLAGPEHLAFAPWWLPASDTASVQAIRGLYDAALDHPAPARRERTVLARLRDDFTARCTRAGDRLTVGEALWQAADALYRAVVPTLPELALTSLTRSPVRHILADALAQVPGGLLPALQGWARQEQQPMFPLLAVATSAHGIPLRVRLHARTGRLDTTPLTAGSARPTPLTEDGLLALLEAGRLIPGARLTALAETAHHLTGQRVRHFGNTYGHHRTAARLLEAPTATAIPCCPDDQDSWHYADLPYENPTRYPLHLIELAACDPAAHRAASALIDTALLRGEPVHLELKGDLGETVRSGGARLLR
ncbi:hypothetical protein ACWIG3_08285 [Streptomyces celluloflavus]